MCSGSSSPPADNSAHREESIRYSLLSLSSVLSDNITSEKSTESGSYKPHTRQSPACSEAFSSPPPKPHNTHSDNLRHPADSRQHPARQTPASVSRFPNLSSYTYPLFHNRHPTVNPQSAGYFFSIFHFSPTNFFNQMGVLLEYITDIPHTRQDLFQNKQKIPPFPYVSSNSGCFLHPHGKIPPDFLLKIYQFPFVFFRKCDRVILYTDTFRIFSVSVSVSFCVF